MTAETGIDQALFQQLLEAAPDAMVIVDQAGLIVLVNRQAEEMFQHPRGAMVGHAVEMLVPLGAAGSHVAHRTGFMAKPVARPMGAALDLRGRRKDGSEFPVEISLSPLRTPRGMLVTAAIRDVTERRRLEGEREEARTKAAEVDRLRRLDAFKSQFLNMAAHELRTPLLPIRTQLYLLRQARTGGASQDPDEGLNLMTRNVERLSALVEDLLEAARYQAGKLAMRPEPGDLVAVVREAVDVYRSTAERKGLVLKVDAPASLPGTFDVRRIGQVALNVVANAVKFTGRGGTITVRLLRDGDRLRAAVTDEGIGIADTDLPKLFQPFVQVHDTERSSERGTGLGLYICRGFVEAHGGRIWAESRGPGQGSTFTFEIPAEARVAGPQAAGSGEAGGS